MYVTPDYIPHKKLEDDIKNYLKSRDYLIHEATYHAVGDDEVREILQTRFTPTALYLRGRADRVAIHTTFPLEFEFECKTHISRQYNDMTLEMLPLIHHLSKNRLGVNCLYAYRNPYKEDENDYGFWIAELPQIRQVWIPPLERNDMPWFRSLADTWFPDIEQVIKNVGGTGDPYVIIDRSVVKNLSNWKDLIIQREIQWQPSQLILL